MGERQKMLYTQQVRERRNEKKIFYRRCPWDKIMLKRCATAIAKHESQMYLIRAHPSFEDSGDMATMSFLNHLLAKVNRKTRLFRKGDIFS